MNKSVGIANQSQLGRLKLLGLIGFQLLTAAVIIAFAVWAFSHYRAQVRAEVEHDLLAIAELKNQQITDFLKERISDAEVLAQRAGIWTLVDANASRIAQGLDMFTSIVDITTQLKNAYGYGDIVVFDENLQPIYPRHTGHIFDHLVTEALRKAKEKGQPQIADLHFHDENVIHFGIIYPVRASGALEGPVIGYIFLKCLPIPA
jgi:hypothetical protein